MTDQKRLLRDALGSFGTGVCIVTAATETGPIGLTINSFASVSLDPPLILWSLDRASDRMEAFHIVDKFAINILDQSHQDVASHLAKKGAHAIPIDHLDDASGDVPVIHGALAQFICTVENRHDGGDHVIFIGRVDRFVHSGEGTPLLFYRGRYRTLQDEQA